MSSVISWLNENFNNRELASAFWLVILFVGCLIKKEVRTSIYGVFGAALNRAIVGLCLWFLAYLSVLTFVLERLGAWNYEQLTPTIIWYLIGGLPLAGRSLNVEDEKKHFSGYAKDTLSGTAILEFIYIFKTYSFLVELVITPLVSLVAVIFMFSEKKAQYAKVRTAFGLMLSIIVLILLVHSISSIIQNPKNFFTLSTVQTFMLPIYFTLGSIPFFYLLHCYSKAEVALRQITRQQFQPEDSRRYARRLFLRKFLFRPWLMKRAVRQFQTTSVRSQQDVDQIVAQIITFDRESKNPPDIHPQSGWSPHRAREFLSSFGLKTSDYHTTSGFSDWWASSHTIDLTEATLPATVTFYISGSEQVVTKLKLRGYFYSDFEPDKAKDKFWELVGQLVDIACPERTKKQNIVQFIDENNELSYSDESLGVACQHENFTSGKGFTLTFTLTQNE